MRCFMTGRQREQNITSAIEIIIGLDDISSPLIAWRSRASVERILTHADDVLAALECNFHSSHNLLWKIGLSDDVSDKSYSFMLHDCTVSVVFV